MSGFISRVKLPKTISVAAIVLAFVAGSFCLAQMPAESAAGPDLAQPLMSQNELENLVAPVALYPDALLSQVLVASTYPLEVFEAQRWMQATGYLRGRDLMEAAQEQNWDASVQALVAFPDVVARLNRDISWTTALGNAFLEQQADVMNAIQNLRANARENGQLESTPQLSVNMEAQGDQSAIAIQPADPQRMYVPNYDPYAVWGPPPEGDYPALPYAEGNGFGSLLGTVANLAQLLPGFTGLLGPRSWGWALSWLAQTLFVNNGFFSDFGFHGGDGGFRGSSVWVHDGHRGLGGYGNRSVAGGWGRGAGRGDGWRNFGDHSRTTAAAEDRNLLGRSKVMGGENFRGPNRMARGNDWHQFGRTGQTQSASRFGQSASPARNNNPGLQRDYRSSTRNSYLSNSAANRAGSLNAARSVGSTSRYNSFANSGSMRTQQSPRTLTASRSWGSQPNFSSGRMSSTNRGYSSSDRGYSSKRDSSSMHGSSWLHGSSSHSFKEKAPKYKAPHYAKAHGGGHSSGGHSKKSHRG
jgi:hypothetical protein